MRNGGNASIACMLRIKPALLSLFSVSALLLTGCGTSAPTVATTKATTTPAAAASAAPVLLRLRLRCHARALDGRPRDLTTVAVLVRTVPRGRVAVTDHRLTRLGEQLVGRASGRGQRLVRVGVGAAAPGVRVTVLVRVGRAGRTGRCRAFFRPRAVPAPKPVPPAPTPTPTSAPPAPAPAPPAPAPTHSAAPSCYPLSDEGTCYEPGEYCRDSDHGVTGVAGDGEQITCEDNDGWRWEPS